MALGDNNNNWYGATFANSTSNNYLQNVTFSPCGHTVSGRAVGPGGVCPVCAQQHSLNAAMQAKQAHQHYGAVPSSTDYPRQFAQQAFIDEMQRASGVARMNPPEPTIMEWLDQEVASVCKLAFA